MRDKKSLNPKDGAKLLTPWLINKTLAFRQTRELEASMLQNPELKADNQIDLLIAGFVKNWADASPEPASNIMTRVMSRIEATANTKKRATFSSAIDWAFAHLTTGLQRFSAGMAVGTFAGATAASLLAVLVFSNAHLPHQGYLPASGPDTAVAEDHLLLVTFSSDLSVNETADVLTDVGAEIVKGPLPSNLFVLRLNAANDVEFELAKKNLAQKSDVIQILGPYE